MLIDDFIKLYQVGGFIKKAVTSQEFCKQVSILIDSNGRQKDGWELKLRLEF